MIFYGTWWYLHFDCISYFNIFVFFILICIWKQNIDINIVVKRILIRTFFIKKVYT